MLNIQKLKALTRSVLAAAALWLIAAPAQAAMWGWSVNATGIYRINTATAATTLMYTGLPFDGTIPNASAAMAQRVSDGQIFFLSDAGSGNQRAYRWNPATPAVAPVFLGRTGTAVPYLLRMAQHLTNGVIYAVNNTGTQVYTIDQTTGAATLIANVTGWPGDTSGDIAFEPGTNRLIGATYNPNTLDVRIYQIPLVDGAVTQLGVVSGMPQSNQAIAALMIDANRVLYVGGNATTLLYRFPVTGGTAVVVGDMTVPSFDFGTASAPSPTVFKSFTPATVGPNTDSTMTIRVSSTFANSVSGLSLVDNYPTGIVNSPTPGVTNTCGGTVTADAGAGSLTLSGGTLPANGSCTITVKVRGSGTGSFVNTVQIGGASTVLSFNDVAASATLTIALPNFIVTKSSVVVSDPINGTTNPKAIPGAFVDYTIRVENSGPVRADNNTFILYDIIPTNTELFVGNVGGSPAGPVAFTNGSPTSALTYSFSALNSTTDRLDFSNNSGSTYTYVPVANANSVDPAVTNIRVSPTGSFAANTGLGNPFMTVRFRVRIK